MVFWVTIGVIAALLIAGIIHTIVSRYGVEDTWGWFALAAFVTFVMFFVILIGAGNENLHSPHAQLQKRYGLHTLVTKDSTDSQLAGSFFLGFGGVEGSSTTKTKVVYIRTDSDGGNTIHDTTVGRSVIYEDVTDGKPYVEDWVSTGHTDTVWVPWTWSYTVEGEPQHRFHIPKGSILSNYEVNP